MTGPVSDADYSLAFGNPAPLPTPDREPDPLVDSAASDGVQPAERGHVDIPPFGGDR
jgi:hypothetical protein